VDQVLGPNGTPFLIHKACALSAKLVNLLFPRLDQHPASSKNCRRKKIDIKKELNTLPINLPQSTTKEFPFAAENQLAHNFFLVHTIVAKSQLPQTPACNCKDLADMRF